MTRRLPVALLTVVLGACSSHGTPKPLGTPVDAPNAYLGLGHHGFGSMTYEFLVPTNARSLDVEFVQPLRGARVDADALAYGRTFPVARDQRVSGSVAKLDWDVAAVERISITVHELFRERPVVRRWQLWAPAQAESR